MQFDACVRSCYSQGNTLPPPTATGLGWGATKGGVDCRYKTVVDQRMRIDVPPE